MGTGKRIAYPYRDDGRTRAWSIPYQGDEPADAVEVEHDPDAAEPWTARYASGGHPRKPLDTIELDELLQRVELQDVRGRRVR